MKSKITFAFLAVMQSGCGAWLCDNPQLLEAAELRVCQELSQIEDREECVERVRKAYDESHD